MNQFQAKGMGAASGKILKMIINRLTIVPSVEVDGIFVAETDCSIPSIALDALKSRQSRYNDLNDFILHFILIGHEFLDKRDDEYIKEGFIESFQSVGVKSALLIIYSMCRREIITHKDFEKLYPAEPSFMNNKDFGIGLQSLSRLYRCLDPLPDKLSINDELDQFAIRQLENKYILDEPRIFTFHASKMTQNEKNLMNSMDQDFLDSFWETHAGIHPLLNVWDVSQKLTNEGMAPKLIIESIWNFKSNYKISKLSFLKQMVYVEHTVLKTYDNQNIFYMHVLENRFYFHQTNFL